MAITLTPLARVNATRFRRSKPDVAATIIGWSEPVSGLELRPLESSAFPRRTVSPAMC